MASEKIESILESVKSLTVLELNELVKTLEETFDVSAAAMVAAGPAAGGAEAQPEEAQTEFTVILKSAGSANKVAVIKTVRELTGLGLKEAKAVVDEAPKPVKENVSKEEADAAAAKLKEVGAEVEIK